MSSFLSRLEPKVIISAVLAALLLVGVWAGAYRPAVQREQQSLQDLEAAEASLAAAEELIGGMRDIGLENTVAIADALAAMEGQFPGSYDDLRIAQVISTAVSQNGLRLLELSRLEEESIDPNITAVPYRISATGTLEGIQGLLASLPERLVSPSTWRHVTLEAGGTAGLIGSVDARIVATIDLWQFAGARSVAGAEDQTADGDPLIEDDRLGEELPVDDIEAPAGEEDGAEGAEDVEEGDEQNGT